jgi:hypothetical protein
MIFLNSFFFITLIKLALSFLFLQTTLLLPLDKVEFNKIWLEKKLEKIFNVYNSKFFFNLHKNENVFYFFITSNNGLDNS